MKFYKILLLGLILLLSEIALYGQATNKFDFDFKTFSLTDTLYIISEIRDCGEFGGHYEYISIYRTDKFIATFRRQTPCKLEIIYKDPDKPFKRKIELTDSLKEEILSYIRTFRNYKDDPDVSCNAPSSNYIEYRKTTLHLYDDECIWDKSEKLRDVLFRNY